MSHAEFGENTDAHCIQALNDLAGRIGKTLDTSAELATMVPGLTLYRNTAPTAPNPCTYEPSLLIVREERSVLSWRRRAMYSARTSFSLRLSNCQSSVKSSSLA
jgi:hypothetical protein